MNEVATVVDGNHVEPSGPYPPRFWWLKRIAVVVLLAILGTATLRWWWGREAERRLAAVIADAKARGEPILPEEFAPKHVPDADNAAILFQQAAAALVKTPQLSRLQVPDQFTPLTPNQMQVVSDAVAVNRQALELSREASTKHSSSWGTKGDAVATHKFYAGQRELSQLLEWAGLYFHANGDEHEALSLAEDLLHQSWAIRAGNTTIVSYSISILDQTKSVNLIHRFAPGLRIGDATPTVPRKQVTELIVRLLNDAEQRSASVQIWFQERARMLESMHQLDSILDESSDPFPHLLKPTYVLILARGTEMDGEMARAMTAADWPTASSHRPPIGDDVGSYIYDMARHGVYGVYSRIYETSYEQLVERRVAATELAIRLFRLDHGGRYPGKLDDLIPDYLRMVPSDAMAAGNRAIGYRTDTRPPILYSVGTDGRDDGGTDASKRRHDRWDAPDAVFRLEPPSRNSASPPSLETENDNRTKHHNRD